MESTELARSQGDDRAVWFWMLISYMKFKTLEAWLNTYPETTYESFEYIWPRLLDRLFGNATREAIRILCGTVILSLN